LARKEALREEKRDLSQRHVTLAQEFEHRVFNDLTAKTTQTTATQLTRV